MYIVSSFMYIVISIIILFFSPSHTVWNPARSCANSLRQALSSTCFVHHPTVQVFSNHTVLSGMNIIYHYHMYDTNMKGEVCSHGQTMTSILGCNDFICNIV